MSPPLIFEILVQQQQKGGAVAAGSAPSQTASYSVAVDWDADGDYAGTYDELVGQEDHGVKAVRIRRGRDDYLSDMVAGTATIVLHDPDGRFSPANAASPLAGQLLPMRKVRVQGTNDGGATWEGLFLGFIRSIEHDPARDVQETRIECVDQFVQLSRNAYPVALSGASHLTTGFAVKYFYQRADLATSTANIDPDAGDDLAYVDTYVLFSDGSRSLLEEIGYLLLTERGTFWLGKDGLPHYEDRHALAVKASVDSFTDSMTAAMPSVDLDAIANSATVERQEWAPAADAPTTVGTFTATDDASIALYGRSDGPTITSYLLMTDVQAQSLANYLAGQRSNPASRVYQLAVINSSVALMTSILGRELQDRITITESRSGTSGDYIIESISHEITDGGKFHRVSYGLSEAGFAAFTIGYSAIGGTDSIAY